MTDPARPRLPDRIEGDGVVLRQLLEDDAEVLARAVSESEDHLRPWMGFMKHHPQPLEERRAMLCKNARDWAEGGDVMLGIFVGGELAGTCGLHRRVGPSGLEIGYWIHPSFTRRGLATTAARLLTDAAFSLPEVEYVEIHHDKANSASSGVPRRLGFERLGEEPDAVHAPAEVGIECRWRMERSRWEPGCGVAVDMTGQPRTDAGEPTPRRGQP